MQRVFNRALFDAANEALLAIYSEVSRVMVPFVSSSVDLICALILVTASGLWSYMCKGPLGCFLPRILQDAPCRCIPSIFISPQCVSSRICQDV